MNGTPSPRADAGTARLDKLLERAVERNRIVRHGLAAVAKVDGSWSWYGANGILDPEGTSATTTARYPIASVTKLYTAAVALRLVELGKLSLEDRMVDFLPHDVTAGLHTIDGVEHTDKITVEHLLSHTSGLADYYEEAPPGGQSAQSRLLAGEDAPMPFEEVLRVVREDLEPHFPPQPVEAAKPKALYSDTNYQLVGAIVEHLTRQPLHQVFDEMLMGPLGLKDTSSYPNPPRSGGSPEPDASVWSKQAVLRPQGALRHQVADGGIISTLSDQVRFMQALVGNEVFDNPASWQRMQQRWSRVFFPIDYGLGVMRYAPPRWMSPAFRIPPVVGHTGSTATWLFHCPELDIVLAGTFDVAQPQLPFRFLPRVLRAVSKARPTST